MQAVRRGTSAGEGSVLRSTTWIISLMLFVSCFFVQMSLKAQYTVPFEKGDHEVFTVNYQAEPDSSGSITNIFIREIAKSIPKRFDYTSYKYSFKQVLRVIQLEDGRYEASIDINEARCIGDVVYKDFDISDVLFPNGISMRAVLYDKYKKEVYSFDVNSRSLHWGYNKLAFYSFRDTIKQPSFTFSVVERSLYFDQAAIDSFNMKLQRIDEYYQSKAIIARGNQKLDAFDFKNIDMIIVYDIMLDEIEKQVEALYARDFPGKLSLSGHDPIGYIDLFMAFSERCRSVRAKEDACLSSLDKIYYEQGLKYLEMEQIGRAMLYFKRSCLYNPLYVPSYYQRAKILYVHDSVSEAADLMQQVLTTMNPDPLMSDSVLQFSDKIFRTLQQQGMDYLKLEKFNESLQIIERAIRFCEGSPGLNCTDQIYKDYASSKFGIYQSYLSVAERATQSGRYDLAEVYITAARTYQRENAKEIIGAAAADAMTSRLAKAMVVKADTLNSKKKYEQALLWYDRAAALCDSVDVKDCAEGLDKGYRKAFNEIYSLKVSNAYKALKSGSLDNAEEMISEARSYQGQHTQYIVYTIPADTVFLSIQAARYHQHIRSGQALLQYYQYEEALLLFEKATALSQKYSFRKDPALDTLIPKCARPVMLMQTAHVKRSINMLQIDSAGIMLKLLDERLVSAHLENDSLLQSNLAALHVSLDSAICYMANARLTKMNNEGTLYSQQRKYIDALQIYKDALSFAQSYTSCNIDTTTFYSSYVYSIPAAKYLKLLALAVEKLNATDTASYFSNYMEAEAFYNKSNIAGYGIIHKSLVTEICESSHLVLKVGGIRYFCKTQLPLAAFAILESQLTVNKPTSIQQQLQTEVGKLLAEIDFAKDPLADPIANINRLLNGRKWFNFLKKSYLGTWKRLAK